MRRARRRPRPAAARSRTWPPGRRHSQELLKSKHFTSNKNQLGNRSKRIRDHRAKHVSEYNLDNSIGEFVQSVYIKEQMDHKRIERHVRWAAHEGQLLLLQPHSLASYIWTFVRDAIIAVYAVFVPLHFAFADRIDDGIAWAIFRGDAALKGILVVLRTTVRLPGEAVPVAARMDRVVPAHVAARRPRVGSAVAPDDGLVIGLLASGTKWDPFRLQAAGGGAADVAAAHQARRGAQRVARAPRRHARAAQDVVALPVPLPCERLPVLGGGCRRPARRAQPERHVGRRHLGARWHQLGRRAGVAAAEGVRLVPARGAALPAGGGARVHGARGTCSRSTRACSRCRASS